jgi:hypothetical protein
MPRKHYSEATIQQTLELYRSLESTGHHKRHGVKSHMARIISYSGTPIYHKDINNILDILKERGQVGDHHTHKHDPAPGEHKNGGGRGFHQAIEKERLREAVSSPKTQRELTITPGVHKILAIPDSHASVYTDNGRFDWAAKLAKDRKVGYVVQIGDFCSWDSVSTHEKPGTIKFSKKPNFETEFSVFHDALSLLSKIKARKIITFGNHESRLYNYEDQNPACAGMLSGRMEQAFESNGWEFYPYGMEVFVEGVSFTHKPFNIMGKPKSNAQIRRDLMYDMYTGHDHHKLDEQIPKQGGHVTLISGGCFMPDGYEPDYAKFAQTGWFYGCQILTVENGKIQAVEWISMKELERKYGNAPN